MTESTVNALLGQLKRVRKAGTGWVALCPCHADRNPSLSVFPADGRWFSKCHACEARTGDVLRAVGLADSRDGRVFTPRPGTSDKASEAEQSELRRKAAYRLWLASLPLTDSCSRPAMNYLRARGICLDERAVKSIRTLRFHQRCQHPDRQAIRRWLPPTAPVRS